MRRMNDLNGRHRIHYLGLYLIGQGRHYRLGVLVEEFSGINCFHDRLDAYLEIILVIINRDDGRALLSLDLALLKHSCHLVLLLGIDLGRYLRRAR